MTEGQSQASNKNQAPPGVQRWKEEGNPSDPKPFQAIASIHLVEVNKNFHRNTGEAMPQLRGAKAVPI